MEDAYQPFLLGVDHREPFVKPVIRQLLRFKPKVVGLEVPRKYLQQEQLFYYPFWGPIIELLHKRNIRVVPLVSDGLFSRLEHKFVSQLLNDQRHENGIKIDNLVLAMVTDSMTRDIARNARRYKPDVIITGISHALPLRKDLGIKKQRFRVMWHPSLVPRIMTGITRALGNRNAYRAKDAKRRALKDVKSIRRFRATRKKRKPNH